MATDGINGGGKTRVVRRQKIQFAKEQEAGIQVVALEGGDEAVEVWIPGPAGDDLMEPIGLPAPLDGALGQGQPGGDARQAVAAGPADDRREGMDGGLVAQLPGAGVRLVEDGDRQPAQFLQPLEQHLIAGQRQAAVEEGMGGGENDAAIDVVLDLEMGLVADPYRSHAPVTQQAGGGAFLQVGAAGDAIAGP